MAEKNSSRRVDAPPRRRSRHEEGSRRRADYAAELRAQMAADERRRDADRRDDVGGGFIGSANLLERRKT